MSQPQETVSKADASEHRSLWVTRQLSVWGHGVYRWLQQPTGIATPLTALIILLLAPQAPDMLAGLADVQYEGQSPFNLFLSGAFYGLAAAILGFCAWYWMRAGLQGANGRTDAAWLRLQKQGDPNSYDVTTEEWQKWRRRRSREWSPRVALLIAGGIAVLPAVLVCVGTASGAGFLTIAILVLAPFAWTFRGYFQALCDKDRVRALVHGVGNVFLATLAAWAIDPSPSRDAMWVIGMTSLAFNAYLALYVWLLRGKRWLLWALAGFGIAAVPLLAVAALQIAAPASTEVLPRRVGLVAAATGLALIAWLLICLRDRWRLTQHKRRVTSLRKAEAGWYWRWRVIAVILAAPFGWFCAVLLLAASLAGFSAVALLPERIEEIPAPVAALSAMALSIGPLVIALAFIRDAFDVMITAPWRSLRFLGVARREETKRVEERQYGELRRLSGAFGLGAVAWLLFLAPPTALSPALYCVRSETGECAWTWRKSQQAPASQETARASVTDVDKRPNVETAVKEWCNARRKDLCADKTASTAGDRSEDRRLPLIIVTAEGGASRASTWLLSAMRMLDEKTDGKFGAHLFAISGVSGGSLGAVTYAQALRAYERPDSSSSSLDWDRKEVKDGLRAMGKADLLSATIATYFLNDAINRLSLGLLAEAGVPDRAVALERAFERHWQSEAAWKIPEAHAAGTFLSLRRPAENGRPPRLEPPHLLLNGTDVNAGRRLITSTIRFDPENDLFAGSDDLLAIFEQDIPASTAVTNSARFPYISPTGQFRQNGTMRQIVDGGYFENYGLRTATELARKIGQIASDKSWRVTPIIVVISNDGDGCRFKEGDTQCGDVRPMGKTAFNCRTPTLQSIETLEARNERGQGAVLEALAPFLGLIATRSAHGEDAKHIARRMLCQGETAGEKALQQALFGFSGNKLFHIAMPKPIPENGEAAPLNWVLNNKTADFLLGDGALEAPFNADQTKAFNDTLTLLLTGGGERKGEQMVHEQQRQRP